MTDPTLQQPGRRSPGSQRLRRPATQAVAPPLGAVAQPLYEQAYRALAELVASGAYRRGSRLPSERALSEALGISRPTLRRALESLVALGILERGASRGWFAASGPVTGTTNELLSFSNMARARGLHPSARVLECEVRPATLDEGDALRIAPGAPTFDILRLRMLDGIPIAVDRSRIPLVRAPWLTGVDFAVTSLHASLEGGGVVPTSADYTIGVVDADERLASLLELSVGRGLLHATGITYDQHGVPFELGWAAYRPDRYRIQTRLTRTGRHQMSPGRVGWHRSAVLLDDTDQDQGGRSR